MIKKGIILLKRLFRSRKSTPYKNWLIVKGDETLRLNYPLSRNSIVFDLGGYKGQWASDIYSKYLCTIYVFEPVKEFFEKIKDKFSKNSKIKVFNFGISNKTKQEIIFLAKDGSSIYGKGKIQKIQLKSINEFLNHKKIRKIDLIKINVEGEEYKILSELIQVGFVKKIKNIQVQFHKNIPGYKKKYKKIREMLERSHKLTYYFPFVWENWELKNE